MSTHNYRMVNLALPTGGSSASQQHGKRQEAIPSSPSSALSPSRSRGASSAGPRSGILMKPLIAQGQNAVNNSLSITGHQPQSASSIPQAVVIYGQTSNFLKPSAAVPGEHLRPRTATLHGTAPSPSSGAPSPRGHSSSQHTSITATSASPNSTPPPSNRPSTAPALGLLTTAAAVATTTSNTTAPTTPATNPAVAVPADDELLVLKEQILKLQRALETLCRTRPGSGSVSATTTDTNNILYDLNVSAIAVPAAHATLWTSGGCGVSPATFATTGNSSAVSVGGVSSSSLGSATSAVSNSSNSSSSSTCSNSSMASNVSARISRSGEPSAGSGTGFLLPHPAWVAPSESNHTSLTTTTTHTAAAAHQDAALNAARAKLLDLFVRKAHQLLLESAPELLMQPQGPRGLAGGSDACHSAPVTASGESGGGGGGGSTLPFPAPPPGYPSPRLPSAMSGPSSRARASGSVWPGTAMSPHPGLQPTPAHAGLVGAGLGAGAPPDMSPAGVLVAASRRLVQLQAVVSGRDGGRASLSSLEHQQHQLADTRAKLESALADNTLLRNMVSELQANAARPLSRNMARPPAEPPPSRPSTPPTPDPALLRHISNLTADLAAARDRHEAVQQRLTASEGTVEDLRRQLQEAQSAAATATPHETEHQGCQVAMQDPEAEAQLEALRTAAASEAAVLRARIVELEAAEAGAARAHAVLVERAAESESALVEMRSELRRLVSQAVEKERGGVVAAAAADSLRRELDSERRQVADLQSQLDRATAAADEAGERVRQLEEQLAAAVADAAAGVRDQLEAAAAHEAATRRRAESEVEGLRLRLGEAEAALGSARREATAAVEKGDRKRAELAARISSLDSDVRRLSEELRTVRSEAAAAGASVAVRDRELAAAREEKIEACTRFNAAQLDLEAERRRLAEEIAATQKLRTQLMEDANAVKALGTLVAAKTLRLDIGGGGSTAAGGPGGGMGSGVGAGSRPGTGDAAAHVRLTNLVKEQQEKLVQLSEQLASREDRCGRLQVALTAAQEASAQREAAAGERATAATQRAEQLGEKLAELQASYDSQQAELGKMRTQLEDALRHDESVTAHNTDLHKMAEKLQREGAATAAEARDLRAKLATAIQQLSDEQSARQRLQEQVADLSSQLRDTAVSEAAAMKAQRRAEGSRWDELQAALLLATQKLAGAERTITAQDERIALLLARVRAAEEHLLAAGLPLPSPAAALTDATSTANFGLARALSTPLAPGAGTPAATPPASGSGSGSGLQPPVGSLSTAPESGVAAQQRLNALMTGGSPALGSMVQDMINKVLSEAGVGGGGGGGGGKGGGGVRDGARGVTSAVGPSGGGGAQQQRQQSQPAANPQMFLRPSSASVVGRVQEYPQGYGAGLPGFGRQAVMAAGGGAAGDGSSSSWSSGFAGGAGGGGASARPQSAWVHRAGAGGFGMMAGSAGGMNSGGGGGASGSGGGMSWGTAGNASGALRRLANTNVGSSNGGAVGVGIASSGSGGGGVGGGSQLLPDPDMAVMTPTGTMTGGSGAGGGFGTPAGGGGLTFGARSPSPVRTPGGLARRLSSSSVGVGAGGAGAASGSGRPSTAVSKRTLLLLSTNSTTKGQVDELLPLDDDWQPV